MLMSAYALIKVCQLLLMPTDNMTTYNPGSLADILHCAGLEDDSIALFIAIHPKMALPKFQRGL
jgi:hypothetical protein